MYSSSQSGNERSPANVTGTFYACANHRHWMSGRRVSEMHDANIGTPNLAKSRVAASAASISTERRVLGWAVTLAGAALMLGGATIVILSVLR
jgi:hypothetical protein